MGPCTKCVRKLLLAASVSLVALVGPNHVRAQAEPASVVAAGTTVGALIDQITSALDDLIANSLNGANDLSFSTLQNILLAIDLLKNNAVEFQDKLLSNLDQTTRQAFNNISASIDKLSRLEDNTSSDAEQLLNNVNLVASRMPFADKTPSVSSFSPRAIIQGIEQSPFQIKITGTRLANPNSTLDNDANACQRIGMTDLELDFTCAQADAPTFGTLAALTSYELTLYRQSEWWKRIFGIEDIPQIYQIPVIYVYRQFADYELNISGTKKIRQERSLERDFYFRNDHCDGKHNESVRISAPGGWTIVHESLTIKEKHSKRSRFSGFNDVTDKGFIAKMRVINDGNCVKVAGAVVSYDGRGSIRGTIKYKVERQIEVDANFPPANGKLYWDGQTSIKLPPNAVGWDLAVTMRNGEVFRASGAENNRWFSVSQPSRDRVIIKPNSIQSAFKS